uniref:Uncharacterized protein n=1 Tax=Panagrolaimus sp. PS1159 TaxID=55785 RepID=A0AC35F6U6_9BILA
MKIIEPDWFKNLSENVKGKTEIYESLEQVETDEWHKMIEGDRVFVVDSFIAGRNFLIHQNLDLYFTLRC